MSIKDTLIGLSQAILDLDRYARSLGPNASAKDRVEYRVHNEKLRVLGEKLDKLVNIAAKQELRQAGILKQVDDIIDPQRMALPQRFTLSIKPPEDGR